MKNIAVIFGGVSLEHDVSIITGLIVVNSIDKTRYNPVPVYVGRDGKWYTGDSLKKLAFYKAPSYKKLTEVVVSAGNNYLSNNRGKRIVTLAAAVNCMHGGSGENGTIAALFDLCGVPFVGSWVFGASATMDKAMTKILLSGLAVKTVEWVKAYREDYFVNKRAVIDRAIDELGFPLIVKPARTGSSIGVGVAHDKKALEDSLSKAFLYDDKVLIERYLANAIEINCACYKTSKGIFVSECERPCTTHDILTFEDKYSGSKTGEGVREFPARLDIKLIEQIKQTTKRVYCELELSSTVRIDYLLKDNVVYLNEINSIPGSFAYYLFCNKISQLTDLLTDLIEKAMADFVSKASTVKSFESSILSFEGLALKK